MFPLLFPTSLPLNCTYDFSGPSKMPFFADVKVRTLSIAEKRNIMAYIRELRGMDRRRNPPTSAYRIILDELLQGDFHHSNSIPSWVAEHWAREDQADPDMAVLHDFDNIMLNADLARLGFFIRTREGQRIKNYLKLAFTRVTMALPSSIYSLFDGDAGIFAWSGTALNLVRLVETNPPVRDTADAFERILKQIDKMTHVPDRVVEIVM